MNDRGRRRSDSFQCAGNAAIDLGGFGAADAQRKRDIFEHRHVRPDRVGLEHHADVPVIRFDHAAGG